MNVGHAVNERVTTSGNLLFETGVGGQIQKVPEGVLDPMVSSHRTNKIIRISVTFGTKSKDT